MGIKTNSWNIGKPLFQTIYDLIVGEDLKAPVPV